MKRLAYLPAVAWGALLLWAGGQTALPTPPLPLVDKVSHFAAYGVLGLAAAFGWRTAHRWPRRMWPLLFAIVMAAGDEARQRSVDGRTADVADWMADVAGFTLAYLWLTRPAVHATPRRAIARNE